jgi:cellulose synthase/poly-beta-1,6-N-acetylglucosamine synthase-like glycosyltransferase
MRDEDEPVTETSDDRDNISKIEPLQKISLSADIAFLLDTEVGADLRRRYREVTDFAAKNNCTPAAAVTRLGIVSYADYLELLADHLGAQYLTEIDSLEGYAPYVGNVDPAILANNPRLIFGHHPFRERLILLAPDINAIDRLLECLQGPNFPRNAIVLANPSLLRRWIIDHSRMGLAARARHALAERAPEQSASQVVTPIQRLIFILVTVAALLVAIPSTGIGSPVIHAFFTVFFFLCVGLRVIIAVSALRHRSEMKVLNSVQSLAAEAELPVYSVLVALYREANQAAELVETMGNLRWSHRRLEVKYVVEEDDPETAAELRAEIKRRGYESLMEVLVAPDSDLKTKPRALNYALPLTRGDYIVVYDAEDRPDPYQLLEAASVFARSDKSLGCLQAPLSIRNGARGWLATMFAVEYDTLFRAFLPGLARFGLAFSLGGTSNHFRRDALVSSGAWDPYNVTEDADLGLRLVRFGYRLDVIRRPTSEEAPVLLGVWIRQRTRWFKGWMQTWLVHMRYPILFVKQTGAANALLSFVLFGGTIVSALLHPWIYVLLIWYLFEEFASRASTSAGLFEPLFLLDSLNIFGAFAAYAVLSLLGAAIAGRRLPWWWLLTLPFYWLLTSVAAWRALLHLARNPFLWEKTPHGL